MKLQDMAEAYDRWHADKQARESLARLRADMDLIFNRPANQPEFVSWNGQLMPLEEFQRLMGWR